MKKFLCALTVFALMAQLRAQTFEVASVKRNVSGQDIRGMSFQPARYVATNVPVRTLILFAYSAQNYQLVGAPDWINADFYDIVGKAPDSSKGPDGRTSDDDMRRMVQRLLADRFNLQISRGSREVPIYALMVARPDGALGPGLRKSDVDCDQLRASGSPPPRPVAGQPPVCGGRTAPGQLPMFDDIGAPSRVAAQGSDPSGPSLFTAIQEQLGLRLDSIRGPSDVFVIEHIDRPTEN